MFTNWNTKRRTVEFKPKLYQCSDVTGKLRVEEIANFYQEDLDGDDVMILDGLNTIYVWIGSGANNQERDGAKATAKKYLDTDAMPRHKKATVEVIWQGQEPPTFKKMFPSWDDKLFANQARSYENMRKLLFK
ncbi:hypothetical protein niasHS_013419 [Heterodera schachtii]|uniref:Gelsolin-like domain-containing protein n=1 Tax=Heterodera schachtii TaxID=97005 RepID=A0ABD2I7U6_HETSC